jgi:hypothetical protein
LRLLDEGVDALPETEPALLPSSTEVGPGEGMVDGQRFYSAAWLKAYSPADKP